jgi:nardilysin
VIKLENQLLALLISDPAPLSETSAEESGSETSQHEVESEGSESEDEGDETAEKLAAAALCINVGSFSDHGHIQGLSHFLEHMIFMGSSKYPSENEYDSYIKKCGGSDNAETNYEETSFYFEIAEKYLDGAMDRFSQLFTEPLMLKDTMSREREAVDSEFQSTINSEGARQNQLMVSFGHTAHPCTVFAWGNLKTLKDNIDDEALYQRVHDFRKRHYSAHRMTLCVQARLPLDVLEVTAISLIFKV